MLKEISYGSLLDTLRQTPYDGNLCMRVGVGELAADVRASRGVRLRLETAAGDMAVVDKKALLRVLRALAGVFDDHAMVLARFDGVTLEVKI